MCVFLLFFNSLLFLPSLLAQSSQSEQKPNDPSVPEQPIAPLPADVSTASGTVAYGVQSQLQSPAITTEPDTHVLSGVENLTAGTVHRLSGIFDPGFYLSDFGYIGLITEQPGAANATSAGSTTSGTTVGATLDAQRGWARYNLAINYRGSDTYYYPYTLNGPRSMPSHTLGLSLRMPYRRWTFLLRNDLLYSWQASFGSLFTGGPSEENQNNSVTALQPSLNPVDTILTGFARQLNNMTLGEVDYALGRRSTVTVSGSYRLLHFLATGFVGGDTIDGRAGYNYSLTSKNTVGLILEHDRTSYSGTSTLFDSNLVQMSFGRKITGRLAFQIAGGPELIDFQNYGASNRQQLSWSLSTSLTRQTPRTTYLLSYLRGVTAGSGVFVGSEANTLTASVNHLLTTSWSTSLRGGYALNSALVSNGTFAQSFADWFVGANLSDEIGRHVQLALSYQYQRQIMASGACPVASCGVAPVYQVAGLTLNWHPWSNGFR